MNKFALILGLLLLFNLSKSIDDDQMSTLYDHMTYILEGMSKTGEGQCAAVFRNNKSVLLGIIKNIMNDIKGGVDTTTIVARYLGKLILIDGLGTKCNIFALLKVVEIFNSADGIKNIGTSIVDNSNQIFDYVQEIKNKEELDDKLVSAGRILAILLNFNVN